MTNLERLSKAIDWETTDRILTWDFMDNDEVLIKYGGYDSSVKYTFEEITEINIKAFKNIGLDMTRYIYDPVNHYIGAKIENWIRFFGVNPDNWKVSQKGGTAWISKRPFSTLKELEKNMPQAPKYNEVKEWFLPFIKYIKDIFDRHDLV